MPDLHKISAISHNRISPSVAIDRTETPVIKSNTSNLSNRKRMLIQILYTFTIIVITSGIVSTIFIVKNKKKIDPTMNISTSTIIIRSTSVSMMTILTSTIVTITSTSTMIITTTTESKDKKWKQDGITIAGGNGRGSELNQLSRPARIFIDDDQTIYIADRANHRIVGWKLNAPSGEIIAGENGQGNQLNQLSAPTDFIFDKENNCMIIAEQGNRRVTRWSLQKNTNEEIIIEDIDCWGLVMDKDGSLYVSDWIKDEVRRWQKGEENGTIVAGGNGEGDQRNQLRSPTSIFVDENYSLYVCDKDNGRIMKWEKDATQGLLVAGAYEPGSAPTRLNYPYGLFIDKWGQIYVADCFNHRVMLWRKEADEGVVVVGGNGNGVESNQLSCPTDLSFDEEGNLYVLDSDNARIQKFEIDYN